MHFNIQNFTDGNVELSDSKLWLYVDFVKPGKHTFCVKKSGEVESDN